MLSLFKNKSLPFFIPLILVIIVAIVFSIIEYRNYSDIEVFASVDLKDNASQELVIPKDPNIKNEIDFNTLLNYQSSESGFYIYALLSNWDKLFSIFVGENSLSGPILIDREESGVPGSAGYVRRGFRPGNVLGLVENYGELIVKECDHYNLDWRLILAIIKQESAFVDSAVSRAGAFGFMQIMPGTGAGLERELRLSDTRTPVNNLIAGIYYYATLVASFEFLGEDKYKFALAAYNAGLGRVIDAMTITAHYGGNYKVWDEVKESYPFLASSQDSVHAEVWPGAKRPTYGALNNWREPYFYVEKIMYYWDEYKKMFESNLKEEKNQNRKRRQ